MHSQGRDTEGKMLPYGRVYGRMILVLNGFTTLPYVSTDAHASVQKKFGIAALLMAPNMSKV